MNTAAIRRLAVPSPDELIARARAMVPEIRALAEETERNRNLFPHIVEKIREAELLRTCRPAMFGGFEYDGEVALKIAMTISAGCASTGWTVNGAVSNGLVAGALVDRGAARDLGRRHRPVHLRLLRADRHRGPGRGRLSPDRPLVVRERVRHLGLGQARRDDPTAGQPRRKAPFSCCRSGIARSSTTGSSAACAAPAARTSLSRMCSSRRTGC